MIYGWLNDFDGNQRDALADNRRLHCGNFSAIRRNARAPVIKSSGLQAFALAIRASCETTRAPLVDVLLPVRLLRFVDHCPRL